MLHAIKAQPRILEFRIERLQETAATLVATGACADRRAAAAECLRTPVLLLLSPRTLWIKIRLVATFGYKGVAITVCSRSLTYMATRLLFLEAQGCVARLSNAYC